MMTKNLKQLGLVCASVWMANGCDRIQPAEKMQMRGPVSQSTPMAEPNRNSSDTVPSPDPVISTDPSTSNQKPSTVDLVQKLPIEMSLSLDEDTPTIFPLSADLADIVDSIRVYTIKASDNLDIAISAVDRSQIQLTPAKDFSGSDEIEIVVAADPYASRPIRVTANVRPVNDQPIAVRDVASVNEDTTLIIRPLENDIDVDAGDKEKLVIHSFEMAVEAGKAEIIESGKALEITPASNLNGKILMRYTAADTSGSVSEDGSIELNIVAVNDIPVAAEDSFEIDEDVAMELDVLKNDKDVETPITKISQISIRPSNATVELVKNDTSILFTPKQDFYTSNTEEIFSYTVTDGDGGVSSAVVRVKVRPVNDAPVAVADALSVDAETSGELNVLLNDSDVDGDTLAVEAIETAPNNGTAVLVAGTNGLIRYTPASGFFGTDSFRYKLVDGKGANAMGTVTVTVREVVAETAFLVVELSGGASIAGNNIIVGGPSGQEDYLPAAGYATLGLSAQLAPLSVTPNGELGLLFHPTSALLKGILSAVPAATRAKIEGMVFCAASADDTNTNIFNPAPYIIKAAGVRRSRAKRALIGTGSSRVMGRSLGPEVDYNFSTAQITSPADALSLGGDPDSLNVEKDAVISGIYNLESPIDAQHATVIKLLLDGHAAAATIEIGGYDYHGRGRSFQDRKDEEAGVVIGKALQAAAAKAKDLMVYVVTDGGVSSLPTATPDQNGKLEFTSDSPNRGASYALIYRHQGRLQPRRAGARQMGYYQDVGVVSDQTLIGSNLNNLNQAVVANYLQLHGRLPEIEAVTGMTNAFGSAILDYVAFQSPVTEQRYGKITSVSTLGEIRGWAVDPKNPSANVEVEVKYGPFVMRVLANRADVDDEGAVGNHGFVALIPQEFRSTGSKVLTAYALVDGKNIILENSFQPHLMYGHTNSGREFYATQVARDVSQKCGACHTWTYETAWERLASPIPMQGGLADNNLLINKAANEMEAHPGGAICATKDSSLCGLFKRWWDIEFNLPTGLKNATIDLNNPDIAVFRIPLGTGTGAYNTPETRVEIDRSRFRILRIYNDDTVTHILHTNGSPCLHQPFDGSKPGAYYDCVLQSDLTVDGKTYNHLGSPATSLFYLRVYTFPGTN